MSKQRSRRSRTTVAQAGVAHGQWLKDVQRREDLRRLREQSEEVNRWSYDLRRLGVPDTLVERINRVRNEED